jgi:hypothetical protein
MVDMERMKREAMVSGLRTRARELLSEIIDALESAGSDVVRIQKALPMLDEAIACLTEAKNVEGRK